jgi:8-oxo-dGTP diphosphatase
LAEFWDIVDESGRRTGRLHRRGTPMQKGDYHPSVSVWIANGKSEFLISQRSPENSRPNIWETTGASVLAGEDSLSAAIREVKEELGISLSPKNGKLFKSYTYPHSSGDGAAYIDVWVFRQEADIAEVKLQPGETYAAIWAGRAEINRMIAEGLFVSFSYIDELFQHVLNEDK